MPRYDDAVGDSASGAAVIPVIISGGVIAYYHAKFIYSKHRSEEISEKNISTFRNATSAAAFVIQLLIFDSELALMLLGAVIGTFFFYVGVSLGEIYAEKHKKT